MPLDSNGYEMIYLPEHPLAMSHGYVYTHRLIAAEEFGIEAVQGMHVHHKDGDITNNCIENLEVLCNSDHIKQHAPPRTERQCAECGAVVLIGKQRRLDKDHVFCSHDCHNRWRERQTGWPNHAELVALIEETSFSEAARRLGVSDNAIRKRMKKYKIGPWAE